MSLLKLLEQQHDRGRRRSDAASRDDEEPSPSPIDQPAAGNDDAETALYVATDLDWWETDEPRYWAPDVGIDGTCYRRLDPQYYAWLRSRVSLAQQASNAGRLGTEPFEEIRRRFNVVHAWAVGQLGKEALVNAVKSSVPASYQPPSMERLGVPDTGLPTVANRRPEPEQERGHRFPEEGDWPFTHRVSSAAVENVDAIRDAALELGWTEARLYQNRGRYRSPVGDDYGLVCFVDGKRRIGAVTREWIEIIGPPPMETRLRFYNPDVEQPWHIPASNGNSQDPT